MKRLAFFAAMLAMAASCSVNEIDNGLEVTPSSLSDSRKAVKAPDITAAFVDNGTKTTITTDSEGVGTIWWTPSDEINVFYGETPTRYISSIYENTTSAKFITGDEISEADLAKRNVWGLYPYDENAVCDGSSVTTTIPASQKGVDGVFDEELFTSLAHSTSTDMKFYNVLGGIKFSLSRTFVKSITFRGNNGEDLAGKVSLAMGTDGTPVASVVEGKGEKIIKLTPKESTVFTTDTYYYMVMLPVVLSKGFTMVFDTNDGSFVLNSSTGVEIKRSVFKKADEIDKRAISMEPFTLTAGSGSSVSIEKVGEPDDITLEYRLNDRSWDTYTIGSELNLSGGDKLQFRAGDEGNRHFSKDAENYYHFECSGGVMLSGNVMSLLDGTMQDNTMYDYAFYRLFNDNTSSIDISELFLPATVLAPHCYDGMFYYCYNLNSAPELPATTLAEGCYKEMFYFCGKLTSAPALPASTLATSCYEKMFSGCKALTSAPELPATTLAEGCYGYMFQGCETLTSAPVLPATTLANGCYEGMFLYCDGLMSAPELHATQLAESCYDDMFNGCRKLAEASSLDATQLAKNCYHGMFQGCIALESAPKLPATTLAEGCYGSMFKDCTSLTSAPELQATTLAKYCYDSMFDGCSGLMSAPELPATTLAECCYQDMFKGCTKLTEAPYLPAETLAYHCYYEMFYGCTGLKLIRAEFTDWNEERYATPNTYNWLKNASASGVFYHRPALDVSTRDASHIPAGWTELFHPVESITLDPAYFEIMVGETSAAPTVIFDPEYTVNRNVSWSSSNGSVATVDAAGRVTGWREGTATITAISEDGGKTSQSVVTVIGAGPSDLPGAFSVSSGKTVVFSQGNLFWNGSEWRFENNQYDFPRTWDSNHVGHLAWVNDEAKAVSDTWDKSWAVDCGSLFTNDPDNPGAPNPYFRVSGARGKYRTLTEAEWNYLLNERIVNGGIGKGYSYQAIFDESIGGTNVYGIIIFPDGFTGQSNWKTVYTTWDAINAAGIVFLPAAGFREGTEMYVNPGSVIEDYGYYWTSSLYDKSSAASRAKDLCFDVNPETVNKLSLKYASASDAHSIRLVADSEPAIGTDYVVNGVAGKYVGKTADGKKLIVATKNYGSANTTGKGTAYSREELNSLSIPDGWQLPTAKDMEVLAKLGFVNDSTNDGTSCSKYDFFVPYTQSVAGGLREGRIWVVGGSDNDFYWFRSDNKYGLTTTETAVPNYYVRLIRKI